MISPPRRRSRAALVIAGCASLTSCVVGPDYRAPPAVDTGGGWTRPVDQASAPAELARWWRSEEHTSELQSLMRISYAVFCLKKKKNEKRLKCINYNKQMKTTIYIQTKINNMLIYS